MDTGPVKVLYIGGYSRSGSTLLLRLLGQLDGFVSVGEVWDIWSRSFADNQLCGCGKPFRNCEFWREIVDEGLGGFEQVDVLGMQALRQSVQSNTNIPKLALPFLRTPGYQKRLDAYKHVLSNLYGAIHKVSGGKVIVDSSKVPPYAFLLNQIDNISLHILHLVRDSRATAYSWQRKKVRPEIHWKTSYMDQYSPWRSAMEWNVMNSLLVALKYRSASYRRVRYEEMVEHPKEVMQAILQDLGMTLPEVDFFQDEHAVQFGVDHTLSGNPNRFQQGAVKIKPDVEWQSKMPKGQKGLVTALTLPLLLQYGYKLNANSAALADSETPTTPIAALNKDKTPGDGAAPAATPNTAQNAAHNPASATSQGAAHAPPLQATTLPATGASSFGAAGAVSAFPQLAGSPVEAMAARPSIERPKSRPRSAISAVDTGGPMRILLVTARYLPYVGGTEIHTYEVARRMAAAGHQVTVLTANPTGYSTTREMSDGFEVVRVPAWPKNKDYYYAPTMYRFVRDGDWDIVHLQGYHTLVAPVVMQAARRAGIPYVVTFHSGGHSSRIRNAIRPMQQSVLRPLLARAAALVSVSNWESAFFQKRLNLPTNRFKVIPNGSYLPDVPHIEDTPGSPHNLIVSVGRLERYKGHHRVISALPLVAQHCTDVNLRIVGSGPYEHSLRQLAQYLGVADRVEIKPVSGSDRAGMASVLMGASLVILLSNYESQGIAVMEALALGRPVLVADSTALHDLATSGLARATSLGDNPDEVAHAILGQLNQPHIPPSTELPTWDECAADLMALYAKVRKVKA